MNNHTEIITENVHSKIMSDMSLYLDECKKNNKTYECTAVLQHNPTDPNDFKKWAFVCHCNDINKVSSFELIQRLTINLLKDSDNIKCKTYKVL